MEGIPPARKTDAEDVVWALQTADALWKRNERVDAIVWLRRAAQAAGEADDDERAVTLARNAAELSEALANAGGGPFIGERDSQHPGASPIDDLLRASMNEFSIDVATDEDARSPVVPGPPRSPEPFFPGPSRPQMNSDAEYENVTSDYETDDAPRESVPHAQDKHAGILDPWSDARPSVLTSVASSVTATAPPSSVSIPIPGGARHKSTPPPPPQKTAPSSSRAASPSQAAAPSGRSSGPPKVFEDDEMVTSARNVPAASEPAPSFQKLELSDDAIPVSRFEVMAPSSQSSSGSPSPPSARSVPAQSAKPRAPLPGSRPARAMPPPVPTKKPPAGKPPLPARAQKSAAEAASTAPPPDAYWAGGDTRPPETPFVPPPAPLPAPLPAPIPAAIPARVPTPLPSEAPIPSQELEAVPGVDLSMVDAFADLPDDARESFALAAKVSDLSTEEEVSHFALAYVMDGEVDACATMVDAPAVRFVAGNVLRSRGSIEDQVPLRLICASKTASVAIWQEADVAAAFKSCPWVEEDLRFAANRAQALAGVTVGPLGERLDRSLRDQVLDRTELKVLAPGDVVVEKGKSVPGLIVVGVGSLELVDGGVVKETLGSGDFLFADAVLGAGAAPMTARAGKGGALTMNASRAIAQELLVTCPPLLELFAGM